MAKQKITRLDKSVIKQDNAIKRNWTNACDTILHSQVF